MSRQHSHREVRISDYFEPIPKNKELLRAVGKYSRIFYGGARGGAKTAGTVWVAVLCALQFPGLRIGIVRKYFEELRTQIVEHEFLGRYPASDLGFEYSTSKKTAYFSNGSVIRFRSYDREDRLTKAQGVEFDLLCIDEANQLEEATLRKLMASVRSFGQDGWRATVIMTGNPGGISDDYIITRWVNPDYSRWETGEVAMRDQYHFISSSVYDNPHATKDYIEALESQSEETRRQWLDGDWTVSVGAFFPEWDETTHVVDEFDIPDGWLRWRAIDIGYQKHPSVCLFFTQDPVTGDVYVYDEVATTDSYTDEFASMVSQVDPDSDFVYTMFDPNSIVGRKGNTAQDQSPADIFMAHGIYVEPANNARTVGWLNVKNWMAIPRSGTKKPMLYVFRVCTGLIRTIPLQRYRSGSSSDLNTRGQDDYVDALRYGLSRIPYGALLSEDGTTSADTPLSEGSEHSLSRDDYLAKLHPNALRQSIHINAASY